MKLKYFINVWRGSMLYIFCSEKREGVCEQPSTEAADTIFKNLRVTKRTIQSKIVLIRMNYQSISITKIHKVVNSSAEVYNLEASLSKLLLANHFCFYPSKHTLVKIFVVINVATLCQQDYYPLFFLKSHHK